MANKLYIGGKNISNDIKGLDRLTISASKNPDNKTVGRILSGDMAATGDTYEFLNEYFKGGCDFNAVLSARFSTDICGGINIDSHITAKDITFDPCNCSATFDLITQTKEIEAYNCLRSTAWHQYFVEDYEFPLVGFSTQSGPMSWILVMAVAVIKFMTFGLNLAFSAVDALGGLLEIGADLNPLDNLYAALDNFITGSGQFTVTARIVDILEYHAKRCGLEFKSSIYQNQNSPWRNEVIQCQETSQAITKEQCNDQELIKEVFAANTPVESVIELLEKLSIHKNAKYCIKDGCLIFEHEDIANDYKDYPVVMNATELCDDDQSLEYSSDPLDKCARGRFEYQQDALDYESNKIRSIRYKYLVDYIDTPTDSMNGYCDTLVPYGAARFMFDEVSCERNGALDWENYLDNFRDGGSGIADFLGFSNQGVIRERDLIISNGQQSQCKLLILEDGYNPKDAFVVRKRLPDTITNVGLKKFVNKCYLYNIPNLFEENLPEECGESELINTFHKNRNPLNRTDNIILPKVVQTCNCDDVRTILEHYNDVAIITHYGVGVPESVDISFDETKVTLTYNNIRIYCD